MKETKSNKLANAQSPYLKQHAENPVDWYPWGEEALEKALKEDKPILVSIGYSSCHWCHVMAHESFEDTTVAQLMNNSFVNIKVDREERPDVDQIYMDAVQAMGLNGGWPLNVFLTPDQKPFYGGTYFPKDRWIDLLENIDGAFANNRDKINESASQFTAALNQSLVAQYSLTETPVSTNTLERAEAKLTEKFDRKWGGLDKVPKFPSPSTWQFLVSSFGITQNKESLDHLLFTVDKIAEGGIYDHVGGGFSRYSTDGEWHVPHFEKMLYDNGQLLSLYAEAFKISKDKKYSRVIDETIDWLTREMMDASGGFYAALDADSEGEEGKFYVWNQEDVQLIAKENGLLITSYFDVRKNGNWEGVNVLRTTRTVGDVSAEFDISESELLEKVSLFKKGALDVRNKRIRPGLDDKLISGWNGLLLSGLIDSYQATGNEKFLTLVKTTYEFLKDMIVDGKLLHVHEQHTEGFADDYAAVIQALIKYYETTFEIEALRLADQLTMSVVEGFFDESESLFFYSSNEAESLIARKKELFDNVIPSSNSIMADNLFRLGTHLDNEAYKTKAIKMVKQVAALIEQEPEFLPNWGRVAALLAKPMPEIVIVGPQAIEMAREFNSRSMPNKVLIASLEESEELPLLSYKSAIGGETTIYVCFNKTCKLPVTSVEEALEQIP